MNELKELLNKLKDQIDENSNLKFTGVGLSFYTQIQSLLESLFDNFEIIDYIDATVRSYDKVIK